MAAPRMMAFLPEGHCLLLASCWVAVADSALLTILCVACLEDVLAYCQLEMPSQYIAPGQYHNVAGVS